MPIDRPISRNTLSLMLTLDPGSLGAIANIAKSTSESFCRRYSSRKCCMEVVWFSQTSGRKSSERFCLMASATANCDFEYPMNMRSSILSLPGDGSKSSSDDVAVKFIDSPSDAPAACTRIDGAGRGGELDFCVSASRRFRKSGENGTNRSFCPLPKTELLEGGLRRQRRRIRIQRGAVVLERDLIPDERGRCDVLEVAALFEELFRERSQRVVHDELQTL